MLLKYNGEFSRESRSYSGCGRCGTGIRTSSKETYKTRYQFYDGTRMVVFEKGKCVEVDPSIGAFLLRKETRDKSGKLVKVFEECIIDEHDVGDSGIDLPELSEAESNTELMTESESQTESELLTESESTTESESNTELESNTESESISESITESTSQAESESLSESGGGEDNAKTPLDRIVGIILHQLHLENIVLYEQTINGVRILIDEGGIVYSGDEDIEFELEAGNEIPKDKILGRVTVKGNQIIEVIEYYGK